MPAPASGPLDLHAGETVEVKSREEILASLDQHGSIGGMPFMPEMLAFCGQRFTVDKRADKTCDTIQYSGLRRMEHTVHLRGTRCSGTAHGRCQAACQLYWNEAWLRRVPADARPAAAAAAGCTMAQLEASTLQPEQPDPAEPRYRCQATEVLRASQPLSWWQPMHLLRDIRFGNIGVVQAFKGWAWWAFRWATEHLRGYRLQLWLYDRIQRLRGGEPFVHLPGSLTRTPNVTLGLQAGELVQVKPVAAIRETIDKNQKNRGLYFDREMVPFCGGTYKVRARVSQIIEEKTGRMIRIPGDCVILDNVVCAGKYHMWCPRAIYPYWREIWLQRAGHAPAATDGGTP